MSKNHTISDSKKNWCLSGGGLTLWIILDDAYSQALQEQTYLTGGGCHFYCARFCSHMTKTEGKPVWDGDDLVKCGIYSSFAEKWSCVLQKLLPWNIWGFFFYTISVTSISCLLYFTFSISHSLFPHQFHLFQRLLCQTVYIFFRKDY